MPLSNPAKLLLGFMQASGITDAKDLADRFDIPIRTIQRLKLECATSANDAIYGVFETANCAISGVGQPSDVPRAYIESPTEIDSYQEVKIISVAPASPVAKKPKADTGRRLDLEWTLPSDWYVWAETNFPGVTGEQINLQADKFRDYWIAKPGANGRKLDWEATWRNWCRTGLVLGNVRKPQYTAEYRATSTKDFADCYQ